MGMHVPYEGNTFRPINETLPGNETSDNPLEFDIVPAWGSDLARIKSIIFAATGLTQGSSWSPAVQEAVIAAFDSGGDVFINTVTAIRGLTIPSAMALRAGLLAELPKKIGPDGAVPDPAAPYAVTSGIAFSRVCGALLTTALHVALEIGKLSDQAERVMDPRNFPQPSGSGGTGTASQGRGSNATTVQRRPRRRGTAASDSTSTGG